MNLRHYVAGLLCMAMLGLSFSSCWDKNESETVLTDQSNALITSFSLKENSRVCYGLSGFAFTIDQFGNSDPALSAKVKGAGIIFNPDSLPVGSEADSVKVSLGYKSPRAVFFRQYDASGKLVNEQDATKDSAVYFHSYPDTRLEVLARDGVISKTYFIKINVHTTKGDTIEWKYKVRDLWDNADVTAQRVDTIGQDLYWLAEHADGSLTVAHNHLLSDLGQWSTPATISTPEALDLSTLYCWENALYAVGKTSGALLTSPDASQWSVAADNLTFVSILGKQYATRNYGTSLKAIVRDGDAYRFAASADGKEWTAGDTIPEGFPISGFTMPISSPARPQQGNVTSRIYIVGGMKADGTLTSSTWITDGNSWIECPQNDLPAMRGASIVCYTLDRDKNAPFWVLHPGVMADGSVSRNLWFSENDGITWKSLKRWHSAYSDNSGIAPVACSSAFCNPNNYMIYFFGGTNAEGGQDMSIYGGNLRKLNFQKYH